MIKLFLTFFLLFSSPVPYWSGAYYDPFFETCVEIENTLWKEPLEDFAEASFGLSKEAFTIKQFSSPEDLAESGMTGPLFIVFEKGGAPVGVIKSFSWTTHEEKEAFVAECSALDLFAHLPQKAFHSISLIGIEEREVGGEMVGFLAETFAHGNSINSYMKRMKAFPLQRSVLYEELKEGVASVAVGLADLHNCRSFSHPAPYYVDKYSSLKGEMPIPTADAVPGPYGYIHGDTHPGNIYYDAETDRADFIDFGKSYPSRNGGPIGQDVANFLLTLELIAAYYELSPGEIDELQAIFLSTYREHGPMVSDEVLETYRLYLVLLLSKTFSDPEDSDKEAQFFHNYLSPILNHPTQELT